MSTRSETDIQWPTLFESNYQLSILLFQFINFIIMTDIDDFDNQISNDLDQFEKDINTLAKKEYDTK